MLLGLGGRLRWRLLRWLLAGAPAATGRRPLASLSARARRLLAAKLFGRRPLLPTPLVAPTLVLATLLVAGLVASTLVLATLLVTALVAGSLLVATLLTPTACGWRRALGRLSFRWSSVLIRVGILALVWTHGTHVGPQTWRPTGCGYS